jgi:hypothetical protein
MHTEINIFDKPIERIRKTCELVADGETSEERLTVSGLTFVRQAR